MGAADPSTSRRAPRHGRTDVPRHCMEKTAPTMDIATFWFWLAGSTVLAVSAVAIGRRIIDRGEHAPADRPAHRLGEGDAVHPRLSRRKRGFVGHVYPLVGPMSDGHGRVRIGDTVWNVESSFEGLDLADGTPVRVLGARGAVLLVEPEGRAEA